MKSKSTLVFAMVVGVFAVGLQQAEAIIRIIGGKDRFALRKRKGA